MGAARAVSPHPGRRQAGRPVTAPPEVLGTVVVVDDHPLLAHGLSRELDHRGVRAEVVVPGLDRRSPLEPEHPPADGNPMPSSDRSLVLPLVSDVLSRQPDLVLVDLDLPIAGGGHGLVRALAPEMPVAVLTGSEDRLAWWHCLEAGARAVLSKSDPLDRLLDDILALLQGRPVRVHQHHRLQAEYLDRRRAERRRLEGFDRLSGREADVLAGLVEGHSPAEIAERDYVSVQTVRSQIKSVLAKLGVRSQLAAVARANRAGWREAGSTEGGSRGAGWREAGPTEGGPKERAPV